MSAEPGISLGIAVRFALYVDLMLVFGVPAFALYAVPGRVLDARLALRRLVPILAIAGLVLSTAGLVLLAAGMSGVALAQVDWPSIKMIVIATATGTAWMVRVSALLAVIALTAFGHSGRLLWPATVICAVAALSSLAWLGHGVMDDGRTGSVHLIADIGHLLAAGIWVGALAGLLLLLRPFQKIDDEGSGLIHRALAGFATVGTATVALLLATGLVNSWLLVGPGNILSLGTSLYGQLLLIKLALFAGMVSLAAINRFRLTPALGAARTSDDARHALQQLQVSLTLETFAAIAILGLVAWLGTLEPPISTL